MGTSTFSDKDGQALKHPGDIDRVRNNQKKDYGNGISTLISIYNVTGAEL